MFIAADFDFDSTLGVYHKGSNFFVETAGSLGSILLDPTFSTQQKQRFLAKQN
jgi:hypothetical protein